VLCSTTSVAYIAVPSYIQIPRHLSTLQRHERFLYPPIHFSYNATVFMDKINTYLNTYLIHGAESFLRSQSVHSQSRNSLLLWNLKVHYHVHKSLPPVPVLRQINPVYDPHPTSYGPILILYFHLCLGLPSGLFPSGFHYKNPVSNSPLPHTCYMPRSSHSSRFAHPNNIYNEEICT